MSLIYREALVVGLMILISLLVIAKGDKQMVHILEGKLLRQNRDMSIAATVYRNHKKVSSVILFMVGFVAIAVSVIFLTNGNSMFPIALSLSIIFLGLGIWGRINTFCATDRALDNAALSQSVLDEPPEL